MNETSKTGQENYVRLMQIPRMHVNSELMELVGEPCLRRWRVREKTCATAGDHTILLAQVKEEHWNDPKKSSEKTVGCCIFDSYPDEKGRLIPITFMVDHETGKLFIGYVYPALMGHFGNQVELVKEFLSRAGMETLKEGDCKTRFGTIEVEDRTDKTSLLPYRFKKLKEGRHPGSRTAANVHTLFFSPPVEENSKVYFPGPRRMNEEVKNLVSLCAVAGYTVERVQGKD